MDLEYVLKWMVGLGCLFSLALHVSRRANATRGWIGVLILLLGLLSAGVVVGIPKTGYLVGALWFALVGLPMFATRRQAELLARNELGRASRWARISALLHPFDGYPGYASFIRAQTLAEQGRTDAALACLRKLSETPLSELARLEALRLECDWAAIVKYVQAQAVGTRDLRLAPLYLQALGETGDVDEMLTNFRRLPALLQNHGTLRLRVAAYTGLDQLVQRCLAAESTLPAHISRYIAATAKQAVGERQAAGRLLEELQAYPASKRQALRRLRRPLEPVDVATLSPKARAALQSVDQHLNWERSRPLDKPPKPIATWALAATLLVVFLLGIPGGTTDQENLVNMGALILPQELRPGAWRLVSAGFVHFGATHLALNLLALLLVGGALERLWGRLTLLGSFLGGSIGAYWLATLTLSASFEEPKELLGASAGVFGLVGALIVFELVGAAFKRTRLFNRRVLTLAVLVLAQLVFDWFTPIVSSFLHLAGIASGAIAALPLAIWNFRPASSRHDEVSASKKGTARLLGKL